MRELTKSWLLIKAQYKRLNLAVLESHGLNIREIIISWLSLLVLVVILSFIASVSYYRFSGAIALASSLSLSLISNIAYSGVFVVLMGLWVARDTAKKNWNWAEWIEFCFICSWPFLLTQIISALFSGLLTMTLVGAAYSLYLFYLGLKNRFRFWANKGNALVVLMIGIYLAPMILVSILPPFKSNDYSDLINSATIKNDDEMSVDLPKELADKVAAPYKNDPTKQKAALQFANAIWRSATPEAVGNYVEATVPVIRATDCLFDLGMDEGSDAIMAIVLADPKRSRLYLERNQRLHDHILPNPPPGPVCD